MGQPVVWFEVLGEDREKLVGYYERLFGWNSTEVEGMPYSMIDTGGEGINGGIGLPPQGRPGGVMVYVQSADVAADLRRAEELGGRSVMGPTEMPGGRKWALMADPEGHVIGLFGG